MPYGVALPPAALALPEQYSGVEGRYVVSYGALNSGTGNVGFFNSGTGNDGFGNSGTGNVGFGNAGDVNTGF